MGALVAALAQEPAGRDRFPTSTMADLYCSAETVARYRRATLGAIRHTDKDSRRIPTFRSSAIGPAPILGDAEDRASAIAFYAPCVKIQGEFQRSAVWGNCYSRKDAEVPPMISPRWISLSAKSHAESSRREVILLMSRLTCPMRRVLSSLMAIPLIWPSERPTNRLRSPVRNRWPSARGFCTVCAS